MIKVAARYLFTEGDKEEMPEEDRKNMKMKKKAIKGHNTKIERVQSKDRS